MFSQTDLKLREVIEINKMRYAVTRRVEAGHAIPNTTLMVSADFTEAVQTQRVLIDKWRSMRMRPQYQDLVITALVEAIKEHPRANAHLIDNRLYVYEAINVGLAVAVEDGLMVPIIKDAQTKTLVEIARDIRTIVRAVKNGKMSLANISGGTITVSSLTGYGIDGFTPIINAPEANVLGIGKIEEEPRIIDGNLCNRWIGHLSLTFDHRAWDGAPAGRFLRTIVSKLQSPAWMVD